MVAGWELTGRSGAVYEGHPAVIPPARGRAARSVRGMTRDDASDYAPEGEIRDDGTTGELLNDKMAAEDLLRAAASEDATNVNDQPGFQDGSQGGRDFEDRQGTPNNDGDSDLEGRAAGGDGTHRSGGIDGGPARTTPLPGAKK